MITINGEAISTTKKSEAKDEGVEAARGKAHSEK